MKDTIHGKKKSWPHFDTFYVNSNAYAEGYNRIFGKKDEDETEINETRRGRQIQKAGRKVAKTRGKKSQSTRRLHRAQKVRQETNGEDGR